MYSDHSSRDIDKLKIHFKTFQTQPIKYSNSCQPDLKSCTAAKLTCVRGYVQNVTAALIFIQY